LYFSFSAFSFTNIVFFKIKINNFDCTKLDSIQVNKILQNEQNICNSIKLVVSKKPKNILLTSNSEDKNLSNSRTCIESNSSTSSFINEQRGELNTNCRATAL
jgi:hypothetical protein